MTGRNKKKRAAVLGAGNWGTTLAVMLAEKGYAVRLWEFRAEAARKIQQERENKEFLPGIPLPDNISVDSDMGKTLSDNQTVFWVLPSKVLRSVCRNSALLLGEERLLVSAIKGIEVSSLMRCSQVLEQELGQKASRLAVLSGPNIAPEIARHVPSTTVVAAKFPEDAKEVQEMLRSHYFRVYTGDDIIGLELGGSLKNIIAIAGGIIDGLGLGANTKGALLTRGLAEITRLGVALGARPDTFAGLSGMGDLITTCFSQQSRNRSVGQQIGQGRKLGDILKQMSMVAEGVETTKAAHRLAQKHGIEMPITQQMYRVLFEDKDPAEALKDLMGRDAKAELW
ncbi:MAG: glycerol-3-phosphate dehydrogenase [Candidatus Edwardsbacteria bacterium RIFOXYD12_FULL_50_11]|jgi:glycerol-3-phosphate dehydrogenase (NAD(P)+)|uniref:Glycerol-3-phosphate dehydrogenase [NAD(P)+] n=1 Tax=Candidatus Edwardsbacteria bacterium GWF2_54_11 TaxID=1817851 RepID=A0A1F5RG04_9BACT|nr:MAG: glycerol-3-phosphate dehydrogenase [Candidatus Edwardsbacteria bacterium RifOxyC12_full_54_24]OGF08505.1 MAG: glycerol-3-phosphate dehydrogenase [Candidatus Edwardsbacteria bacterium RifOxyA12_full_54_48]OGF11431.1 MAG: glycerol-3-phosphate dehydrogenase [Candidatus Edwardsbacteria bacterium GWE2_54_12]OGF13366.1 MAG: glycerol-3-phosphate dehydrogenase [Candidatus Edwardsbacteria bacterium GWF2_54_11]OGF16458.1 MAG: glycerol-3-phosphate dehydrogenase [Candidatus Edwardsbacteria bacteriu